MSEIGRVISQLEQQRGKIDQAIAALRGLESGGDTHAATVGVKAGGKGKKRFSAAVRKRIAEAVRKHWAKKRAAEAAKAKKGA